MVQPSLNTPANLSDLEKYLTSVANLNFEKQYLSNAAVVEPKCFLGRYVRYIPGLSGLFRYFFGTNIATVRKAFVDKMEAYEKEKNSELPRERRISLVKSAQQRFNELIDYINSKRTETEKVPKTEMLFDLQFVDVRWKSSKQAAGGASVTGMVSYSPSASPTSPIPQILTASLPPLMSSQMGSPSAEANAKDVKKD